MKFRSPGTLGTKRKKKKKEREEKKREFFAKEFTWMVRGALSEPGALGVQSVTTLIYLCIPTTVLRIQLPNRKHPPQNFNLMSKHMLIYPNQDQSPLITGCSGIHLFETIQNSKRKKQHTVKFIIANLVVPSSFYLIVAESISYRC